MGPCFKIPGATAPKKKRPPPRDKRMELQKCPQKAGIAPRPSGDARDGTGGRVEQQVGGALVLFCFFGGGFEWKTQRLQWTLRRSGDSTPWLFEVQMNRAPLGTRCVLVAQTWPKNPWQFWLTPQEARRTTRGGDLLFGGAARASHEVLEVPSAFCRYGVGGDCHFCPDVH